MGTGCIDWFTEYENSSGDYSPILSNPGACWSGNMYAEQVLENPTWSGTTLTAGTWDLMIGDYVEQTVSVSVLGWTPGFVATVGELQNSNDQSPGYYASHLQLSGVKYLNGQSGSWLQPGFWFFSDASFQQYDSSSWSSNDLFYIWDSRQNSGFE
jgi:hypothetical protein